MASVLVLSSLNRNFPSDVEKILGNAKLDSHRYESLQSFLASPLRSRPFVALFEIGTKEDLERAFIAKEWIENMQPPGTVKVIAVFSNKNINAGDKQQKFPISDTLHFPITAKNLLFKIDLHVGLLDKVDKEGPKETKKNRKGFTISGTDKITTKERVLVMVGPTEQDGRWKNENQTPTGKTRWRWIKSETYLKTQDNFEAEISWVAESHAPPIFNTKDSAWEIQDPDAELICLKNEKVFYSTKENSESKPGETLTTSASPASLSSKQNLSPKTTSPANPAANSSLTQQKSGGAAPANSSQNKNLEPENSTNKINFDPNPLLGKEAEAPIQEKIEIEQDKEHTAFTKTNPKIMISSATQHALQDSAAKTKIENDRSSEKNTSQAFSSSSNNEVEEKKIAQDKSALKNSAPEIKTDKIDEPKRLKDGEIADMLSKLADRANSKAKGEIKFHNNSAQDKENFSAGINDKTGSEALTTKNMMPREATEQKTYLNQTDITKNPINHMQGKISADSPIVDVETKSKNPLPANNTNSFGLDANQKDDKPTKSPETVQASRSTDLGTQGESNKKSASIEQTNTNNPQAQILEAKSSQPLSNTMNLPPKDAERSTMEQINLESNTNSPSNSITSKTPSSMDSFERTHFSATPVPEEINKTISATPSLKEEKTILSGKKAPEEEAMSYLKKRHFVLMTLEQLQDKNSSWHPITSARVYLSAHHRYYGIKKLEELFPIWIYEGELAPEFLDQQQAWKFYDRPPTLYSKIQDIPAYLINPFRALLGMSPQSGALSGAKDSNPGELNGGAAQGSDGETAGDAQNPGSRLLGKIEADPLAAQKKKKLFKGLLEWIAKIFGK